MKLVEYIDCVAELVLRTGWEIRDEEVNGYFRSLFGYGKVTTRFNEAKIVANNLEKAVTRIKKIKDEN